MAGNIEDKAKYALREYDVRRGGGCDWFVKGYDGVEYKLRSCVYEHGNANSPAKVVRVLVEAVSKAKIMPKTYVEPVTPLEKFEGELHDTPKEYVESKKEYKDALKDSGAIGDAGTNIIGVGVVGVVGLAFLAYMLLKGVRK